mmetsp:Transcript_7810/g.18830  ORF Transcript_7810/g.18830 Transcript_7810/m.18830 type:complete len:92 (-) Transcript_7810:237-512(-)
MKESRPLGVDACLCGTVDGWMDGWIGGTNVSIDRSFVRSGVPFFLEKRDEIRTKFDDLVQTRGDDSFVRVGSISVRDDDDDDDGDGDDSIR